MNYFTAGDIVRIIKGPMLGYKATILSRWDEQYRIVVEANNKVMNYPCDSVGDVKKYAIGSGKPIRDLPS